jgi:peptidoglycan hydrolase-like protein with peptidoglycan-binding domain
MAEPVLKRGSNDPTVRDLQQALKTLGHDPGAIDGVFGASTESAVKAFQQAREIPADGIVGRVRPTRASPCCGWALAACRSAACRAE